MYLLRRQVIQYVFIILNQIILFLCVECSDKNLPKPIKLKKDGVEEEYKPLNFLGNGVQGTVYLVENIRTKKEYALKFQKRAENSSVETVNLFKNYLKHENIIKFYTSGHDEIYDYLLFEYLPITLHNHLKKTETLVNFIFIMKQMLDVLSFLQSKKIAFGDFMFTNVMVDDNLKVKVIDFGIASFDDKEIVLFSQRDIQRGENNKSEYAFYAPEVRNGNAIRCISDVYSFAYSSGRFLMTKKIEGEEIKNDMNDFLRKCLEEDPEKRITADIALLHPFFNILYDFVFCFSILENIELSTDGITIRVKNKILYYEDPEYSFKVLCCCSENKEKFTEFEITQNQINLQQRSSNLNTSEKRAIELASYRVVLDKKIIPIHHLSYSYYNNLKDIFSKLHQYTKQAQIKQKSTKNETLKYIIGFSIFFLIIGVCAYFFFVYKS